MTAPPGRAVGSMMLPTVLLLCSGISYGSMFSANKKAVEAGLPVFAYAFWQALFAAVILLGASLAVGRPPRFDWPNLKLFILVALTGLVGSLLVFASVADKVPPSVLTLIVALIPAVTYLMSYLLRMERLRWLSVAGVTLGFGGILLVVLPGGSLPEPEAALWVVFALLVPVVASINNVFAERFAVPNVSTLALAGGMMTVASVFLFAVMLARDGLVLVTDAGEGGYLAVLWATAAQSITYVCFFEIVRRAGALFFALINYVVVAAGLFWANLLYGDRLSPWVWGAVAVIVISLVLMNAGTARAVRDRQARASLGS